jgi:hypothetical protein
MSEKYSELRKQAVEYVAQGHADPAQLFTTSDCRVERTGEIISVQLWVALPAEVELPKADW